MAPKLRQIQKFVEVLDRIVADVKARTRGASSAGRSHGDEGGGGTLRIVDVGCGRGYLTFAAHAHFHGRKVGAGGGEASVKQPRGAWPGPVETVGVERRRDLVDEVRHPALVVTKEIDVAVMRSLFNFFSLFKILCFSAFLMLRFFFSEPNVCGFGFAAQGESHRRGAWAWF